MKPGSAILLAIAKRIPRGSFRIMRFAAQRDPALQDLSLPLQDIPFALRADLRESVYATLFRRGSIPHQRGLDLVCRRALRPGDVVYDVGANVGYTTALFAHCVGTGGRVVSVEPSPRTFALLARSLERNAGNVTLLNLGLSDTEGQLTFYVPPSLDLASFVPVAGAEEMQVRVSTLDALSAAHGHPRFVKVDVEGHEPGVLAGAAATLQRDDRPMVVFEALVPALLERCVGLLSELGREGYRFRRIRNDGTLVAVGAPGSSDYIAIPAWAAARLGEVRDAGDAA